MSAKLNSYRHNVAAGTVEAVIQQTIQGKISKIEIVIPVADLVAELPAWNIDTVCTVSGNICGFVVQKPSPTPQSN